ncbi:hypothetical protein [Sporocytophaga myxococcoides]|uniref:hypothetical protein n=1 Tax=Sporocytophaga myxococcoides TaxID=153721 RepID=UPI0018CFDC5F|nr:hypothetical protein [Sporocytophaga myxococcoides]
MMALKIWAVIYPSITIFLLLLGEQISAFPLYIRTLILTTTLVPWMVFAGLPLLDKGIHRLKGNSTK